MNQTPIMPRSHLQSFVLPGRRANRILREGLEVTIGHHAEAAILRKFIHWTGRLWDFDQFMHEERARGEQEFQDDPPESGWMEKTARYPQRIDSVLEQACNQETSQVARPEGISL